MKRAKGFTLVELVIVIVIVGILSVVAVPIYRGYTRKAMASEGKALLGTVQTSEKVYFAEHAAFLASTGNDFVSIDTELDVDARSNKYFKTFKVTVDGQGAGATYTAITTGTGGASGIGITMFGSSQSEPSFAESGLNS